MKEVAKGLMAQILNESVKVCIWQALADFKENLYRKVDKLRERQAE